MSSPGYDWPLADAGLLDNRKISLERVTALFDRFNQAIELDLRLPRGKAQKNNSRQRAPFLKGEFAEALVFGDQYAPSRNASSTKNVSGVCLKVSAA